MVTQATSLMVRLGWGGIKEIRNNFALNIACMTHQKFV